VFVDRYEMIPVALARTGFEAKLMAARLGSEGVVWSLRGDVDGLYPVGGIEVLVPSDEADRARDVLGGPDEDGGSDPRISSDGAAAGDLVVGVARRQRPAVVTIALLVAIAFVLVRLLAMG
jgi:hypothetical protein